MLGLLYKDLCVMKKELLANGILLADGGYMFSGC